jgi:hypothetical protein
MATVQHPRPPRQRTFSITFHIEGTDYVITPLACHQEIGCRALRFAKQTGDGAVYDLHLSRFGWSCECMGFLRHGYCKHVRTVQKAGLIFHGPAVTDEQVAEAMRHCPPMPEPTEEEVNDMARRDGCE